MANTVDAIEGPPRKSSASDAVSETSSVIYYEEEPFATFQHKAHLLAQKQVWKDADKQDITVERMLGGGYNRVIGLTRQYREKPRLIKRIFDRLFPFSGWAEGKTREIPYILRIPRFPEEDVIDNVAANLFVRRHTKIPAPNVIMFDGSDKNEIGSPYMIQNRVKGTSLHWVLSELSPEDKCQLAKELGSLVRQMLATRSDSGGKLALPEGGKTLKDPIHVIPFRQSSGKPFRRSNRQREEEVVEDLIDDAILAWDKKEITDRQLFVAKADMLSKFRSMTIELSRAGYFRNLHYTLAHLDFAPRNILVDMTRCGTGRPLISAVLDWDSAIIGPSFMACSPPVWLWGRTREEEEEEERLKREQDPTAKDVETPEWEMTYEVNPSLDPEERELRQKLKQLFEEAAGPTYMRFAYEPAYQLARRLVRFLLEGLYTGEQWDAAEVMLAAWAALPHEPVVPERRNLCCPLPWNS